MSDAILILNAGSSSLKFTVFPSDGGSTPLVRGQIESLSSGPRFRAVDGDDREVGKRSWDATSKLTYAEAIEFLLSWGKTTGLRDAHVVAAGHRVVHGGTRFNGPVRITDDVLSELEALIPLAPLHQPHNLEAIRAVARIAPQVPQVACFDTAFHRTMDLNAQRFAIPRRHFDAGVRRYGFHGLSYEYIALTLPGVDAEAARGRTIVAHLGNGASLCALRDGRSVATTMGLTAIDGLVMGTRCGELDPGVVFHLLRNGMSVDALERMLYEESGLLGVSGVSSDMRTLLASDAPAAMEAIDLFVYRAACSIGAMAAALEGVDALVFTGGIGEHAAAVRAAICRASRWLGLEIDDSANARNASRISRHDSRVTALVIPTNEELMIARHVQRVLGSEPICVGR